MVQGTGTCNTTSGNLSIIGIDMENYPNEGTFITNKATVTYQVMTMGGSFTNPGDISSSRQIAKDNYTYGEVRATRVTPSGLGTVRTIFTFDYATATQTPSGAGPFLPTTNGYDWESVIDSTILLNAFPEVTSLPAIFLVEYRACNCTDCSSWRRIGDPDNDGSLCSEMPAAPKFAVCGTITVTGP
jgi:hypothetical protein